VPDHNQSVKLSLTYKTILQVIRLLGSTFLIQRHFGNQASSTYTAF
jgi:hypothetical protein